MQLVDRYQQAIGDLLYKVRTTQRENIEKCADIFMETILGGGKIYLSGICHGIEMDIIRRGGGPVFYKKYDKDTTELKKGDVIVVSSVSGRTKPVVDFAYDCVQKGIKVIALTSMEYAVKVDPVHESGKKLYEFATFTLDNCAPAAEAMLDVEGIEAKFGAASGFGSDFIMWSITANLVEKMLKAGYTPGILKSANYADGMQYNKEIIDVHYEKYGY